MYMYVYIYTIYNMCNPVWMYWEYSTAIGNPVLSQRAYCCGHLLQYQLVHTSDSSHNIDYNTNSTAQGGGGSFKNRKPIGEVGCCESGMAERSHWWTERWLRSPLFLSLSLTIYLPTYLPTYLSIYVSIYLSIYLPLSLFHLIIYLSIYLSIYLPFFLLIFLFSLPLPCSPFHLSILSEVWLLNFLRS